MYYVQKSVTISAAHHLRNYEGKCKTPHGHNWKINVFCKGDKLDQVGMLIDFAKIKEIVYKFDHKDFNTFAEFGDKDLFESEGKNPTAENIAKHLFDNIPFCYRIEVEETDGAKVIYEN